MNSDVLSLVLLLVVGFVGGCQPPNVQQEESAVEAAAPMAKTSVEDGIEGVYSGRLPCASCPGIDTRISLREDGTYWRKRVYIDGPSGSGGPQFDLGRWHRTPSGRIVLTDTEGGHTRFMDLGGAIRLLNLRGRRIESDLDYDLQQSDEPFGDFGEADLMGMFVYFADASIFDPCYTGSRIPVAMVERHIDLEHAYMKNRSAPAAPLLVRIIARIENRPAMEGEGQEESLVVTAVRDVSPGESCARIYTLRHEAGWHLAELDGLPIASRDHAPPPELAFHGSDLSGFTGCNRLTASFIATEDSLRLGPIVTTRRACPDSTESRFLELLKTVDAYEIIDDKLILESDDMSVAVLHASQDPKSE